MSKIITPGSFNQISETFSQDEIAEHQAAALINQLVRHINEIRVDMVSFGSSVNSLWKQVIQLQKELEEIKKILNNTEDKND
jgi:hypothetical protein